MGEKDKKRMLIIASFVALCVITGGIAYYFAPDNTMEVDTIYVRIDVEGQEQPMYGTLKIVDTPESKAQNDECNRCG